MTNNLLIKLIRKTTKISSSFNFNTLSLKVWIYFFFNLKSDQIKTKIFFKYIKKLIMIRGKKRRVIHSLLGLFPKRMLRVVQKPENLWGLLKQQLS